MANKLISKINLGAEEYDIKDAQARTDIVALQNTVTKSMHLLGTTTTNLSDNATTNPIIVGGVSVTAKSGDVAIKDSKEFVFGEDAKWHLFGDTSGFDNLGALAYKDSATGSTTYTPSGTVSKPTFTGTQATITTADYTPGGTVSDQTATVTLNTDTIQPVTSVGSAATYTLPSLTTTVADETLTIAFSAGTFDGGSVPTLGTAKTFATTVKSAIVSKATFSGTKSNLTATYTPSGTVSQPTFTGTQATISITVE